MSDMARNTSRISLFETWNTSHRSITHWPVRTCLYWVQFHRRRTHDQTSFLAQQCWLLLVLSGTGLVEEAVNWLSMTVLRNKTVRSEPTFLRRECCLCVKTHWIMDRDRFKLTELIIRLPGPLVLTPDTQIYGVKKAIDVCSFILSI